MDPTTQTASPEAVCTEHWPQGKGNLPDYWLAWCNGVQSDGESEALAIENAKAAFYRGEPPDPAARSW